MAVLKMVNLVNRRLLQFIYLCDNLISRLVPLAIIVIPGSCTFANLITACKL